MSTPTVRRHDNGRLELIEPEDCDNPVEVSLELLREMVAAQSLVSELSEVVLRRVYARLGATEGTP